MIVKPEFCSIYYTLTLAGLKNVNRYIGNIVLSKIVILGFRGIRKNYYFVFIWKSLTHLILPSKRLSYFDSKKIERSLAPPPHRKFHSLFSYIASKHLAFKTSLPLGISNDLPWGGYRFFLTTHYKCYKECILSAL